MRITNVLRTKGSVVATVPPDAPVTVMLAQMAKHRVGAVVVVDDGTVVGMVISCLPADEVDGVLRIMTDRRIRHLPVMVDNKLIGAG